jgi:glycosyltransferase involved in cell wall biosynthesis
MHSAPQTTKIAILNAAGNPDYLYHFVSGLAAQEGVRIDIIDSNQSVHLYKQFPNVRVFPLLGQQGSAVATWYKVLRHLRYYWRLAIYCRRTDAAVFHIQWLNRFPSFERLVVVPALRLLRKRMVYTAHNVDTTFRDRGRSSWLNRLSLRTMYRCFDRVVAHSESIKSELTAQFGIAKEKIAVIPHGVLGAITPSKSLTRDEARKALGIPAQARVVLFFGNWEPYKGLDILVNALACSPDRSIHLLIAGAVGSRDYFVEIEKLISRTGLGNRATRRPERVPDEHLEVLFRAADCTVLPYRRISQSGVPFMSYAFGVPVLAAKVGGLPEAVIPGVTGMLYESNDVPELAQALTDYFASDLYRNFIQGRAKVAEVARDVFSWQRIGAQTLAVYRSAAVRIQPDGATSQPYMNR